MPEIMPMPEPMPEPMTVHTATSYRLEDLDPNAIKVDIAISSAGEVRNLPHPVVLLLAIRGICDAFLTTPQATPVEPVVTGTDDELAAP